MSIFVFQEALLRKLTVFTLLLVSVPALAQSKKKVAVLDFNYGTVKSSVQAIFGTNQDIGKGITDLLIDKLVNDGAYRVIERDAMSKIVQSKTSQTAIAPIPARLPRLAKSSGSTRS